MKNDLNAYSTIDTVGKSQIDLLLKVYDGAIAELTSARALYVGQKFDKGFGHLERAEKMVTHLYTTLDPEQGGGDRGQSRQTVCLDNRQTARGAGDQGNRPVR